MSAVTFDRKNSRKQTAAESVDRPHLLARIWRQVKRVQRVRAQRVINSYAWLIRDLNDPRR